MTDKTTRFRSGPPKPTRKNPYAQLDWLWKQFIRRYSNRKTRENHLACLAAYKRFLKEAHGYDDRLEKDSRYFLSVHCDHFVIHNAVRFWREEKLTSYTIHAYTKNLRRVVNYAATNGLTQTQDFIEPQVSSVARETSVRAAYTEQELEVIRKVITQATKEAMQLAAGYKPTGIGKDPRLANGKASYRPGVGWPCWDNVVWYFENVMDCQPIFETRNKNKEHDKFWPAIRKYHGGTAKVWERLGVYPQVGSGLIVPLAMKLAWETGLNAESIRTLKRDCFHEAHPLTGLPYIRYYKERSTGEKELHLALFDGENQADMHLLRKQSEIIRRTIELILKITEPLVSNTREGEEDRLLLFQPACKRPQNTTGDKAMCLNKGTLQFWSVSVRKKALEEGLGELPKSFNLSRFRPTKITEMVREGYDFFSVQVVAGHSQASTTARYLASYQLAPQAEREVSDTLVQIHRNAHELEIHPKPYATGATMHQEGVIYKGILCDCKNVFEPPPSVRRLPTYTEGQPCTYWNMCLPCPNVLITRKHLPNLVAYAREIDTSVAGNNLTQAPNTVSYQKTRAILGGIFNEFGETDLAWARELAECADPFIDPLTYHGVIND